MFLFPRLVLLRVLRGFLDSPCVCPLFCVPVPRFHFRHSFFPSFINHNCVNLRVIRMQLFEDHSHCGTGGIPPWSSVRNLLAVDDQGLPLVLNLHNLVMWHSFSYRVINVHVRHHNLRPHHDGKHLLARCREVNLRELADQRSLPLALQRDLIDQVPLQNVPLSLVHSVVPHSGHRGEFLSGIARDASRKSGVSIVSDIQGAVVVQRPPAVHGIEDLCLWCTRSKFT
mmetsp:Transcript_20290/g.40634  ORF Transcript_20290/g.40634 Transcript_20290/m.40634 type:complete len:227 (+) Transcript_20290:574-1254(+)